MAKKSPKKNSAVVLAIDLGGTKVAVGAVNARGRILAESREPVELSSGLDGLVTQIVRLATPLVRQYKIKNGAMASAGPLDPVKGELLNPTNLKTKGKYWGRVPIIRELKKKLKIPLVLENDAASAALAEAWIGESKGVDNSVVVTLGTGVGVGAICNKVLVRSGRHMHTEGGHIMIDYRDREWLCGCGNYGCAEAFLSGMNFTKKMAQVWNEPELRGPELVARARSGEKKVLESFNEYGDRLACLFYTLCVLFSPERIVMSGGFSHSSELYLPITQERLKELLRTRREGQDLLPDIRVSQFRDEAGLLGAAFVALQVR